MSRPRPVRRPRRALPLVFGRLTLVCALTTTLVISPRQVRADDAADLNAARVKFQRALELKQAGDFSGALKLFRQVGQVKMSPQVRYHIATCEEEMGQLVAALGGYEIALSQYAPEMPREFLAEVQTSIKGLRARIPKLVLWRGAGAEAATIELDQVKLGESSIGTAIPVDPGPHALVSRAPGFADYSRTITAVETQTEAVTIELVELPPETTDRAAEPRTGYGAWPFVLGGVGVLGLAAGAVLLPVSQGKVAQVRNICGGTDCSNLTDRTEWERARSLANDARTLETAGWIAGGVGVATLAVGVVLLLVDPSRNTNDGVEVGEHLALLPSAPGSQAGFSLVAAF